MVTRARERGANRDPSLERGITHNPSLTGLLL